MSLYFSLAEKLYNELFPKTPNIISKERHIYRANDGSIIFDKNFLQEIETVDFNDLSIILFSDRVVKPYIKLPKYYSLNYIRLYRHVIYFLLYIYKKRKDQKYTHFVFEKDINDMNRNLKEKFKEYYMRSSELDSICEIELDHPVVEQYLIPQILPFALMIAKPHATFFITADNPEKECNQAIENEYDEKTISKYVSEISNILSKMNSFLEKNMHLDILLEKLVYCKYKRFESGIRIEDAISAFKLLASLLRLIHILKLSLKNNYLEFIYKVTFVSFMSVYNMYFPKLKLLYEKKKNSPNEFFIPDIGNIFLFRFINILMSYLKKPELIVEILGGRDLHTIPIAEDEEVKKIYKKNYINPLIPFDTRVVDLLQIKQIREMSESYIRLYSLDNEILRVVLYKNYLENSFGLKVVGKITKLEVDPKKLLSDTMLYEKVSLRNKENKQHYDIVFSYDSKRDISNYKKYGDKVNAILMDGRFSDFKDLEKYRRNKKINEVYKYWFENLEKTDNNSTLKESTKVIEKNKVIKNGEKRLNNGSIKVEEKPQTISSNIRTEEIGELCLKEQIITNNLLKNTLRNFNSLNIMLKGEDIMEEKEFENQNLEEIDENVYNDIINSLSNANTAAEDSNSNYTDESSLGKLLELKREENKLLTEINKKFEELLEIIKQKRTV